MLKKGEMLKEIVGAHKSIKKIIDKNLANAGKSEVQEALKMLPKKAINKVRVNFNHRYRGTIDKRSFLYIP